MVGVDARVESGNQECYPMLIGWWTIGYTPRIRTFLHKVDQECAASMLHFSQRSDGRMDDHSAHTTCYIGDLPKVTRHLSNPSYSFIRRSGVTMRIILPLTVTPLRTVRREEALTQGIPPLLSPGGDRRAPQREREMLH